MPDPDVDELEERSAGWLDKMIAGTRANVYARLRKRYDVTFPQGEPAVVWNWIVLLVTPQAYTKRGANPNDETVKRIDAAALVAAAEIKEAADAVEGLFDLPLLPASAASAISRGTPLGSSDASPYAWQDEQRDAVSRGR